MRAVRVGRNFVADLAWSLLLAFDGSAGIVAEAAAEASRVALAFGASPIPDVIPRVTRVCPFRRIKALLGPSGEAWLLCHGVLAHQQSGLGLDAILTVLEQEAETMQRHGVRAVILAVLMGNRIVLEPQLFWPDAMSLLHHRLALPKQVAAYGTPVANPHARATAMYERRRLIAALDDLGEVARGIRTVR